MIRPALTLGVQLVNVGSYRVRPWNSKMRS